MELEHLTNLSELPEKCISCILSFSTPRDVCRLAAVSRRFRSAANSDTTWDKFLPRHCDQILSKAVFRPIVFSSKKELYFRLCDSILIDGRKKRFWLERSMAKIAYMLSAIDLFIMWGNDQRYWRWDYREDSRFGEIAVLKAVSWFEVWGGVDCRLLSENTVYRVLFVLKFTDDSEGWDTETVKFSVTTPAEGEVIESEHSLQQMEAVANVDGWMEVLAGEFRTENIDEYDSSQIGFRMKKTTSNWKSGLLIDGVKIEPKST